MEYDNNMRGVAFPNDKASTDKHPQMTGTCEIEKVKYFMSVWKKMDRNGNEFLSFAFKRADQAVVKSTPQMQQPIAQAAAKQEIEDSDIPF
jgi:hypothetical protein